MSDELICLLRMLRAVLYAISRCVQPHNILLASKAREKRGAAAGARSSSTTAVTQDTSSDPPPARIASMSDLSSFVLKISDMGLGKQLQHGQSSFGLSSCAHPAQVTVQQMCTHHHG